MVIKIDPDKLLRLFSIVKTYLFFLVFVKNCERSAKMMQKICKNIYAILCGLMTNFELLVSSLSSVTLNIHLGD